MTQHLSAFGRGGDATAFFLICIVDAMRTRSPANALLFRDGNLPVLRSLCSASLFRRRGEPLARVFGRGQSLRAVSFFANLVLGIELKVDVIAALSGITALSFALAEVR